MYISFIFQNHNELILADFTFASYHFDHFHQIIHCSLHFHDQFVSMLLDIKFIGSQFFGELIHVFPEDACPCAFRFLFILPIECIWRRRNLFSTYRRITK
jgi:hypothetical protein